MLRSWIFIYILWGWILAKEVKKYLDGLETKVERAVNKFLKIRQQKKP